MRFPSLTFIVVLFLMGGSAVRAKEPPPPPPPPMAQPESISLYRGRTIEVPLRALGRAPGQLKFLIRTRPQHGQLGPIRLIDSKNAVVSYMHDDSSGAGGDSFTYAAQAPDSAVSASAQVSLIISEQPSSLQVSSAEDFGTVVVGERMEKDIPIRNTGGGIFTGQVEVSAPWQVIGSPRFSLMRDEEKVVRLAFVPTSERAFTGMATFGTGPREATELTGKGLAPFALTPDGLVEFSNEPGAVTRSATVTLQNQTGQDRVETVVAPAGIVAPKILEVPSGGTATLKLATAPGFTGGTEGAVELRSGGGATKIPIRVYPLAAILKGNVASVDFGLTQLRHRLNASLTVRNEGGTNASLSAITPDAVLIVPSPDSVVLAPGAERTFDLWYEPTGAGEWKGSLEIRGGAEPLIIPLAARSLQSPLEKIRDAPSPLEAAKGPAPVPDSKTVELSPGNEIPPITEIEAGKVGRHDIEIRWKQPSEKAVSYRIELRQLDLSGESLQIRWVPWPDPKTIEAAQGTVTAHFEGLEADRAWFIRIRSVDATGATSAPSPMIRMATRAASQFPSLYLVGLALLLGALGAWYWWRKRMSTAVDDDFSRIDRLGKP